MAYPTAATDHHLAQVLGNFARRRVLVVGDVMLDRYVRGDVRRISPEAPIPVLLARGRHSVLGGAANVARNVASLGAHATLVGVVGEDAAAEEVAAQLAVSPHLASGLVRVPGRPTTVKTRFMAGSHQMLRLDEEEVGPIDAAAAERVLAAFAAALPSCEIVVLSDYAKGLLTDLVLGEALRLARAADRPVVADPKRADFAAYARVAVLTPNQSEVARATGIAGADDDSVARAGEAARERAQADAVLVTRSERGLTLVRRGHTALHVPTQARAVADVSGAGDTLVAAFAIALACGAALPDAAEMGNFAAGIVVGKAGTATVSHAELAHALRRHERLDMDEKLADLPMALDRVAHWRAAGLRVGFTNGCFDLIHPGHVRLLARARAACDRLIVALNTDASVRRLKGPQRPVQHETARGVVMASIAAADLVVLFDEDTPEALIAALLPDILFKGADYAIDQVVGGDIVRAHGGEVRLIALEEGHSTTDTIARISRPGSP